MATGRTLEICKKEDMKACCCLVSVCAFFSPSLFFWGGGWYAVTSLCKRIVPLIINERRWVEMSMIALKITLWEFIAMVALQGNSVSFGSARELLGPDRQWRIR